MSGGDSGVKAELSCLCKMERITACLRTDGNDPGEEEMLVL